MRKITLKNTFEMYIYKRSLSPILCPGELIYRMIYYQFIPLISRSCQRERERKHKVFSLFH